MPQRIIYNSTNETAQFSMDRFMENLSKYGKVDRAKVEKQLEKFEAYEPLHVSCLVEVGVAVLPEDAARKYYDDHTICFSKTPDFERLRRITGYLVGTLSRWNDAKKAEEAARVKHSVNGQYSQDEKARIEAAKLENSVMAQF